MASDADGPKPVMQLLATGLQLWIRQRCQSIDSLDIDLHGSALGLLRGRLEGVQLLARRAVYQHLPIEQVQLVSESIRVQMGNLLKGQPLMLEQPFAIAGQLSFTAGGLTALLTHPHWQGLAEQLQEQVLGRLPLSRVRIEAEGLVFVLQGNGASAQVELRLLPRAAEGTIELSSPAGEGLFRFPMDPAITIERVWIEAGMVQLKGRARVSP